jgi:hypothetical protein
MNNTTTVNYNTTKSPSLMHYRSKVEWFNSYRPIEQQWLDVSIIPMAIIGIILNILALIVMRSDKFSMPFYTYLRVYTFWSIIICAVNAGQLTAGSRTLFEFTNSKGSFSYYAYFFFPVQYVNNTYGSLLDIILSMERVVLLSKTLNFFKKINPKLLCFILLLISIAGSGPYFFFLESGRVTKIALNETTSFIIHSTLSSRFRSTVNNFILYAPFFFEVFPIVAETIFNILSVYLIRKYTKNKMKISSTATVGNAGRKSMLQDKSLTMANQTNIVSGARRTGNTALSRSKKMEIKLTILVLFMSVLSTL